MRVIYRLRKDELVVVGALRSVPKQLVDVEEVRGDLTVRNPLYWKTVMHGHPTVGIEPTLVLYDEDDTTLYVPRHYEVPYTRQPSAVVDTRCQQGVDNQWYVEHRIELRDKVQEEASVALSGSPDDKIISLACGKGKTVVSLHSAVEGERFPVLIVVHTNALMDQWRERIEEFLDLRPEQVGHVQGPMRNWKGRPIVIAMLHSLVLKTYSREFYDYFRLVIFDEVHKLGAHLFMKAAKMFRAERWGLSATVDREDHAEKIFKFHLGDVVYKDLEQPLKPKVYFVDTGLRIDLGPYVMRRSGRINMAKLQTRICEDDDRNARILYWLKKAANDDRTILVLGERLTQLFDLHSALRAQNYDSAVHVGAMDKHERKEALRHRIVLATNQLAREGLDRPAFDTLFILSAFGGESRLQQSIGRILRLHDTKKSAKVFVFTDQISIMTALARKMKAHVKRMGFHIYEVRQ